MIPVSKSVSLAKYPGANELRYRGAAKRKMKKTKQKKTRVMLSMKNWHGNWLESVLDVLEMLFFVLWPCVVYFSLCVPRNFTLRSLDTFIFKHTCFFDNAFEKEQWRGTNRAIHHFTFYHGKSVQLRCFSLKRSLYRLIYQSSVIKLSSFNYSWKYWSPRFPDEKKCMPDGLPSAPPPFLHTYTFRWKLVNPHKS